jgi:hypothetical protein
MIFSYSKITTLVLPGGTITFAEGGGADVLVNEPMGCRGLGSFEARAPVDPRGQIDGYILHPFFLPGANILLKGLFHITSSGTEAGYLSARDTLMDSTYDKLVSGAAVSTGTLNFSGGGSVAGLKVRSSDFHSREDRGPIAKGYIIDLVGTTLPT